MEHDEELGALIDAAAQAYELARRHVYDRETGPGPHPRTCDQQRMVLAQERAEQALRDHRARQAVLWAPMQRRATSS